MLTGGDLVLPDRPGVPALAPQPRALLVVLLLNAGTGVSRDWLADLLWPDTDQQTARRRLRTTLLNLRAALESDGWSNIEATRDLISLTIDPMQIDVFRFESAAASDHPDTRAMACELFGGDLLARFPVISDEFGMFLEERRTGLRSVVISILLQTMRTARKRGDLSNFELAFQQVLKIDPVNSPATCLAMETWAENRLNERMEDEYQRFRSAYSDTFDAPTPDAVVDSYKDLVDRPKAKENGTASSGFSILSLGRSMR